MSNLHTGVSLVQNPRSDPDRYWRRFNWFLTSFILLFGLGCLVGLGWSLVIAWHTGTAGAWNNFWHDPLASVAPFFAILAFRKQVEAFLPASKRLVAVRQAALEGDDIAAPLAREQPAATNVAALGLEPITIRPLSRPRSSRDTGTVATAICLLCIAFIAGIVALGLLAELSGGHAPDASIGVGSIIMGGITLACSALAAYLIRRYRRSGRTLTVTVDVQGLHWRKPTGLRRQRHIEWSQARAFVTFAWHSDSDYANHQIYALMAPRLTFCWELTQHSAPEARKAHDELAAIIIAYTKLPLRDLTVALEAATAEALGTTTASNKPKITFPLGKPGTPDAVPGIPPLAAASGVVESEPGSSRRLLRTGFLMAVIAVPTLLLYGSGFALQRIQPGYFAALLTRSEALPPLFVDDLQRPDDEWPVWQPTSDDPRSYTYVHLSPSQSVYQLTGPYSQSFMDAWENQPFSDAVIEVTVRQLRAASDGANGAVGLILRVHNDGDQFVEFQVDPSGDWELWDYSRARPVNDWWHYIDSGRSAAIHRGVGAANRLAILMHGDSYILYVNGQFIAAGTDSGAPASGAAGVYVNSEATGGQFSDFAVCPVYSGLPLFI